MIASLFFSSCSGFIGRYPQKAFDAKEIEARNLLLELNNINEKLTTFKGIGRIKLSDKGTTRRVRSAWIGSATGKLRIEVLGVSGRPVASLASDGRWIYFNLHYRQRYFKERATNASLKNIISLPVKSSDVIALLAGRVPVREHDYATVEKNKSGEGYVLILKKGWGGRVLEKIYLDKTKKVANMLEIYSITGSLVFRAGFNKMQTINGYRVPLNLVISNDNDVNFQLFIEKYWAEVPVSPSMFVLMPPE